jgi:hypothetical protein
VPGRCRRAIGIVVSAIVAMVFVAGCAGSTAGTLATFSRQWDDGRIETLELYADGRVLMNHFGTIDRTTLTEGDVVRLRASLATIRPAANQAALPRLTLTPAGAAPVVVDASPGSAGELFLSLLERHRLP